MIQSNDIYLAQRGYIEYIDKIIKYYYPLIYFYNKNFFLQGGNKDDLIQEGIIGLLRAIKSYDSTKNIKFNSFASLCIQRSIISAIKRYNSLKNIPLNNTVYKKQEDNDNLFLTIVTPEENLLEKEFSKILKYTLIKNLSKFEQIVCSYLITGYTYIEISKLLNTDIKKIDNAIQRIRNKLKVIYPIIQS